MFVSCVRRQRQQRPHPTLPHAFHTSPAAACCCALPRLDVHHLVNLLAVVCHRHPPAQQSSSGTRNPPLAHGMRSRGDCVGACVCACVRAASDLHLRSWQVYHTHLTHPRLSAVPPFLHIHPPATTTVVITWRCWRQQQQQRQQGQPKVLQQQQQPQDLLQWWQPCQHRQGRAIQEQGLVPMALLVGTPP